jgi:3'-5' exonuclease
MAYNLPLLDRTLVSIDIESVPLPPDPALRAALVAEVDERMVMPKTITKPETRAAWLNNKPAAVVAEVDKILAKGGLSAATGRIACIGLVQPDAEHVFCSTDEAEVLHLAFEYISTLPDHLCYIGHNLCGFDLPFIRQRAIVNRRRPPFSLRRAWTAKPWDTDRAADTMAMWSSDRDSRISLDRLCRLLGIPSPKADGMDGSQVWPLFQAGELQKISDYCLADCRAALACYRHIIEVV